MRLPIFTAALACTFGSGALDAQTEDAPENRTAHDVYVLSGCLEAEAEATDEFTLTDATSKGPAPPEAEVDETGAPTTYRLRPVSGISESGVESDELTRYVGFLVEVTVRPPDPLPETDVSPGVAQAGGATAAPLPEAPVYSVTEVTRQGAECE